MTGHLGERRNRTVALVTDDLRLYHRLVPLFESHGLPLLGLQPDEEVPATVRALLGGPIDDPRHVRIRVHDEATLLAALQRLDDRPTAEGSYRQVVFGIDPGETIGLAVVADDRPLLVAEAHAPDEAIERIAHWMGGLESAKWSIHCGDGAPAVGDQVQTVAAGSVPHVPFRFVHEERTTPRAPVTGSRHADAAVHIALRRR